MIYPLLCLNGNLESINLEIIYLIQHHEFLIAQRIFWKYIFCRQISAFICHPSGELPATDFCEQKSMGASGGLFHAQPEGIAETKRIPVAGLLKGLLAVLQFTLLSPGYAVKIPNCPQSSGRSRYPSEDNGHSLSYL